MPLCTCGANIACSRPRIGMLNDTERTNKYIESMTKVTASSCTFSLPSEAYIRNSVFAIGTFASGTCSYS